MPRRRRFRKVVQPPQFEGYKPYGGSKKNVSDVELHYEEFEAIKLADYDSLTHLEASRLMGVSRPTFARVYESARRKIALALVEARGIRAIYGNAWLGSTWFECEMCCARFTIPPDIEQQVCAVCKSDRIKSLKE